MNLDAENQYKKYLIDDLTSRYGQIISARDLHLILGFKSYDAFKQAILRGNLTLQLFEIEGRRGRHAMSTDVAAWLVERWRDARKLPPANTPQTGGSI
jgi:hypothetical protein